MFKPDEAAQAVLMRSPMFASEVGDAGVAGVAGVAGFAAGASSATGADEAATETVTVVEIPVPVFPEASVHCAYAA